MLPSKKTSKAKTRSSPQPPSAKGGKLFGLPAMRPAQVAARSLRKLWLRQSENHIEARQEGEQLKNANRY